MDASPAQTAQLVQSTVMYVGPVVREVSKGLVMCQRMCEVMSVH